MSKINLGSLKTGDVFSEQSHYIFKEVIGDRYFFEHVESGNRVDLDEEYVKNLLQTADQFENEVKVGREDKYWTAKQIADAKKSGELPQNTTVREGDLRVQGIRSIWAGIHSQQVFTVHFNKQNEELGPRKLAEEKNKQLEEAVTQITEAQKGKRGVAKVAEEVIKNIQENPVLPIKKGEERKLRGYKTQFDSINGYYDVIDLDKLHDKGGPNRKVNVNEINWLVFNGTRYIVE